VTKKTITKKNPTCFCGEPLARHLRCEACGILCGSQHIEKYVIEFRGHQLCPSCVENWKKYPRKSWRRFIGREEDDLRRSLR